MNFDDTPEEAAFRAEVARLARRQRAQRSGAELRRAASRSRMATRARPDPLGKAWQKQESRRRLGLPALAEGIWRRAALTPIERVIWDAGRRPLRAARGLFTIGHGMCGPTVMAWATEEQKRATCRRSPRGEEIWCQLFSEPGGGSDLAGLRTRAEKPRRLRRLDHQRPENLDQRRAALPTAAC